MNNETSLSDLGKIIETERFALLRYACYRLGNKEDAEDAVHDCYLKLYKRFSAQQDTMVADLNHYVFRSLSNLCTTRLSVSLKMESVPLDEFDTPEVTSDVCDEEYQRVIGILKDIPKEQAEVIRLRMYGNRSFAEISKILQIPLPTVKSRFLYGLDKLRRRMKQTKSLL